MAMVKKKARRRTRRRWIISRDVEIQGVDISIYIEAEGTDLARLRRSMQHLEARGVLTEPLGGTTDALITIFSEAEPNVAGGEIPNVGAVLAVRPRLAAVVGLAPDEFGLLAAMMLAVSRVGVIRPPGVGIYRPVEPVPRGVSNDPVEGRYFAGFWGLFEGVFFEAGGTFGSRYERPVSSRQ